MPSTPSRAVPAIATATWALLLAGVALITIAFVGLVENGNFVENSWPWWLIGLLGITLVLPALGSPRARRPPPGPPIDPDARSSSDPTADPNAA
jgi:hypothetical protein